MIVTCHDCPRQLAFSGKSAAVRYQVVIAFGWVVRQGEGFLCAPCGSPQSANCAGVSR